MATKAELEQELAALRSELAARDAEAEAAAVASKESADQSGGPADRVVSDGDGFVEDFERDIGEILSELEEFPHKKPLLFALGAFAVGYLLGRSR